jgi:hypothetical protein
MVADRRVEARSMQVEAMLGRALKSGRRIDCRREERGSDAIEAQAGFTDDSFLRQKKGALRLPLQIYISRRGLRQGSTGALGSPPCR